MKTSFTEAKCMIDNAAVWLCLKIQDEAAARKFCLEHRNGLYDVSLTPHKEKRSKDANAYFWALVNQLSESLNIPVSDIYRNAIREIGGNCDVVCVQTEAVETLKKNWERQGKSEKVTGWIAEEFPSKIDGCTNLRLFYGSSSYDSKQMARLIDNIVQDCKSVGIETLPAHKLDALKEAWK